MFVLNFRFKLGKTALIVMACIVVIAIVVAVSLANSNKIPDSATCDEVGRYSLVAETVGGECGFLKQFGLEPVADSRKSESIVIPGDFNEVYDDYNNLQKKIGLDLSRFKGREAEKITYELEDSTEKYAVILVCNGRVIGGHLTNGEYGDENKSLL